MEMGIKLDPNGQNSGRNPDILNIWERSGLRKRSLERCLSERSQVRASEPDSEHPLRAVCSGPGMVG